MLFRCNYDLVTKFDLVRAKKISDLQAQEICGPDCSYRIV